VANMATLGQKNLKKPSDRILKKFYFLIN